MFDSNCEICRRICDDLCSNILVAAGPIITLRGRINSSDFVDILVNQVHSVFRL